MAATGPSTAGAASPATPSPVIAGATTGPPASASSRWLSRSHRGRIETVEVGLVLFIELTLLLVEVLAALDQDRALIGGRLTIIELVPRLCRRRCSGCVDLCSALGRRFLCDLGALFLDQRLAAQLDAIAFDGQHLHHHLVAFAQLVLHFLHAMLGDLRNVQQ